jgi:hypothetical protein
MYKKMSKQSILSEIQSAIDVPMMDVKNISNLILEEYVRDDRLTYWRNGRDFYVVSIGRNNIGFIPDDDPELLEHVRELVNYRGWENADKSVRLDMTSWRVQRQAIRNKIFSL